MTDHMSQMRDRYDQRSCNVPEDSFSFHWGVYKSPEDPATRRRNQHSYMAHVSSKEKRESLNIQGHGLGALNDLALAMFFYIQSYPLL